MINDDVFAADALGVTGREVEGEGEGEGEEGNFSLQC
jgi:hypothetical protein